MEIPSVIVYVELLICKILLGIVVLLQYLYIVFASHYYDCSDYYTVYCLMGVIEIALLGMHSVLLGLC